jgi:hypothetical protein
VSFAKLWRAGFASGTVGDGTAVLDCTSYDNTGYGILATNVGATVSGCTVFKNNQSGISIGAGIVTRCESSDNNFDGIRVVSACRITDNKCYSNGPGGFLGAGIHVIQNDCTIENNIVAFNDYGFDVDSFPSVIIHNSARANGTNNYEVSGRNFLGAIITATANMNAATNTSATSLSEERAEPCCIGTPRIFSSSTARHGTILVQGGEDRRCR